MNLFSFNLSLIAAVFGQNDERKVPPRTPDQRLNFLNLKLMEWIAFNFDDRRPDRSSNIVSFLYS